MEFRNIYSARQETRQNKKAVKFVLGSKTDQNFKEETDVNMILAKYKVTRDPRHLGLGFDGQPVGNPQYGDFGDVGTYQEAIEIVMEAQEQFEQLPAAIRKEVGNTPEGMLKWIEDPANYERGVELGIFEKRIEEPIQNNVLPNGNNNIVLDNPVPASPDNKVTPQ